MGFDYSRSSVRIVLFLSEFKLSTFSLTDYDSEEKKRRLIFVYCERISSGIMKRGKKVTVLRSSSTH